MGEAHAKPRGVAAGFCACTGISTGDFRQSLAALLGRDAPNLSPSAIGRLKEEWQAEYDRWHVEARGLVIAPEIAVGDGARGFWKALEEIFPSTRHERCPVHKVADVLDKMPKSVQRSMKANLVEIHDASARATAGAAVAVFIEKHAAMYAKAARCPTMDVDALLVFFDFPADDWDHLRA